MKLFRNLALAAVIFLAPLVPLQAHAQSSSPILPATTISATGPSPTFAVPKNGNAAIFLKGGTATLQLEASPDNGATWYPAYAAGSNQIYVYTMSGQNMFDTVSGVTGGMLLRFNCTAFTSNVVVTVLGPSS